MKFYRSKGFATVFICIVLSVCILASLCAFELCSGEAASSIANNLCEIAGKSILSEYNTKLYERYGIFALPNSPAYIAKQFELYLESSIGSSNGLSRLMYDEVELSTESYLFNGEELKRQICALYGSVHLYIRNVFSCSTKCSDNSVRKYEREYLICGKENDEDNLVELKAMLFAARLAENVADIYADPAKIAEIRTSAPSVFPNLSQELAVAAMVTSIATTRTTEEVQKLLCGESVPILDLPLLSSFGSYEDYLSSFTLLINEENLLSRIQFLMEENISSDCGEDFSFSDYIYGFKFYAFFSKRSTAVLLGISKRSKYVFKEIVYE